YSLKSIWLSRLHATFSIQYIFITMCYIIITRERQPHVGGFNFNTTSPVSEHLPLCYYV
ncbi:hypothetical protein L9F63_019361, partial [Diploptera punctata]